jgi:hypothetical protein
VQENIAILVIICNGAHEAQVPDKLDEIWHTYHLSDLSASGIKAMEHSLAMYFDSEEDTVPAIALQVAQEKDASYNFPKTVHALGKEFFRLAMYNLEELSITDDKVPFVPAQHMD